MSDDKDIRAETITMPDWVNESIDLMAKASGRSYSELVTILLMAGLKHFSEFYSEIDAQKKSEEAAKFANNQMQDFFNKVH